jgi:hypothetical protein
MSVLNMWNNVLQLLENSISVLNMWNNNLQFLKNVIIIKAKVLLL